MLPSLSLWAGIGLAHGVELGFTTTAEEISLDISLRAMYHSVDITRPRDICVGISQQEHRKITRGGSILNSTPLIRQVGEQFK